MLEGQPLSGLSGGVFGGEVKPFSIQEPEGLQEIIARLISI